MKIYTNKTVNEIVAGIAKLEAELAALHDVEIVARRVVLRYYTDIKPGKRMDELQAALDIYDALDK